MNRFLIFENEKLCPNIYEVKDPSRLEHLKTILKLGVGDMLKVALVGQGIGKAYIKDLSGDSLTLLVESIEAKNQAPYDLIIGLSRPPTIKKILEHATTLGVGSFDFFKADLSEKSYLDSKIFEQEKLEKYLCCGISQAAIYHQLPKVELHQKILNDWKNREQKFILSPGSTRTFLDVQLDFSKRITLAIGPERGWTTTEVETFKQMGFIAIGISSAILRVETATFSSLGQLELLRTK
ncbi:MAG: RsmE family RNA methyltransferase [Deltaproteobacteria bacterium]|nr:MAG: RsmE family RNA methyltransferase [Deltaproteobacteria bacterium]